MLEWSVGFLLAAIIMAIIGFGGVAGVLTNIAQFLFLAFICLFLLSFVAHLFRGFPYEEN